jgi:hypothetical protein
MNRHTYIADESARKRNEFMQGAIIGLATLFGSVGFVLVYLWMRDYHG